MAFHFRRNGRDDIVFSNDDVSGAMLERRRRETDSDKYDVLMTIEPIGDIENGVFKYRAFALVSCLDPSYFGYVHDRYHFEIDLEYREGQGFSIVGMGGLHSYQQGKSRKQVAVDPVDAEFALKRVASQLRIIEPPNLVTTDVEVSTDESAGLFDSSLDKAKFKEYLEKLSDNLRSVARDHELVGIIMSKIPSGRAEGVELKSKTSTDPGVTPAPAPIDNPSL